MRKRILAVLFSAVLGASAAAVAQEGPPSEDPTGGAGGSGSAGCQGVNEARNYTPSEADDALGLVESIIGGEEGCDEAEPGDSGDSGSENRDAGDAGSDHQP